MPRPLPPPREDEDPSEDGKSSSPKSKLVPYEDAIEYKAVMSGVTMIRLVLLLLLVGCDDRSKACCEKASTNGKSVKHGVQQGIFIVNVVQSRRRLGYSS